ncbi:bromodomain factor 2 protein [Novymonas esmeraldas]|uniref:Bromodomain factor 2 protein n=1 Tax=Novymonas esmeraldas TaxID=1808958 RepID=A0AAW0ERP1_9TRYP
MEGNKRPREAFHKEQCLSFVNKLWAADTLAMFHHPVSETDVPGYYQVVAAPMDLSTIRKKVEENRYTSDAEVEDDVALMLSNALDFNTKGSQWYDLARQLKKRYPTLAQQSGLAFDADQVFIPSKKTRDDESTLRKAEKAGDEKLEDVLEAMEKEKEIPLEQLRAMYARHTATADGAADQQSSTFGSSGSDESSEESSDDEASSSDDEEDVSDSEDGDEEDTSESESVSKDKSSNA